MRNNWRTFLFPANLHLNHMLYVGVESRWKERQTVNAVIVWSTHCKLKQSNESFAHSSRFSCSQISSKLCVLKKTMPQIGLDSTCTWIWIRICSPQWLVSPSPQTDRLWSGSAGIVLTAFPIGLSGPSQLLWFFLFFIFCQSPSLDPGFYQPFERWEKRGRENILLRENYRRRDSAHRHQSEAKWKKEYSQTCDQTINW